MDEKFFAWLDGELGPAEAAEMEKRVSADPELGRLAQEHRALRGTLGAVFDLVAKEPVPQGLSAAIPQATTVTHIANWRHRRPRHALQQWAAIAATLVLGVFLGTMTGTADGPIAIRDGAVYAQAGLDRALDEQLASNPTGDVQIGLTFRDASGAMCRSFLQRGSVGVACRKGSDWQVRGLFAAPDGQESEYRMAAGTDPNLAALIDQTITGEPLDAKQETDARSRNWR